MSSKKIIRTVDREGNVTETITNEGDADFSIDEDQFRDQFTTRTSVSSKRIVKTIDSEGNVTEEILQEGDENDFEMDEEKFKKHFMSMQPVTSKTSITSKKIIRTVDSEGNITEKIINEGDSDFSLDEDESKTIFLSSIPVAVKTTSVHTSRKIIKKTDESGNIIEEIIEDPVTESSKVGQIQAEENFDIRTLESFDETSASLPDNILQTNKITTSEENIKGALGLKDVLSQHSSVSKDIQYTAENQKNDQTIDDQSSTALFITESQSRDISVTENSEPDNAHLRPGEIILTVHKARQIEKKGYFGKADPYVFLSLGNQQFKSKTVKNEHNPEWELISKFSVDEYSPNQINISVFDDDFGKDDSLGSATLDINDILIRKQIKNEWVTLQNCKSGEIQISSQFTSAEALNKRIDKPAFEIESQTKEQKGLHTDEAKQVEVNVTTKLNSGAKGLKDILVKQDTKSNVVVSETNIQKTDVLKNVLKDESTTLDCPTDIVETGNLLFTLVGAKDLEKSDYIGKSDPYAVVKYKEEKFKSKTVNNDQNPVWNFSLTFKNIESDPGVIDIQVFDEDYYKDEELGKTTIRVKDLIDCQTIDGKWVKLEDCKSGEVQFSSTYSKVLTEEIMEKTDEEVSSVTGKLEFDLNSTQTKYDITEVSESQSDISNITPSQDYSNNFDKIVKKSCKKIIRRIDSDGNVVEEVVEEGKTPENWETSTVNMSSGIEVVTGHSKVTSIKKTLDEFGNVISEDIQTSYKKDPDVDFDQLYKTGFSAIPTKKTSIKTTKRVIKRIDEEGNIIEETIDEDNEENVPEFYTQTTPVSITRTSTQTSRKIIKRIDDDGNVTEEIITETDEEPKLFTNDLKSQFFAPNSASFEQFGSSSFPQTRTTKTSMSSKKIIRTVDSEGNVTEIIANDGDNDFSIDEDEFKDQFMSSIPLTTKTSVSSKRIVKMIDSEGNVTEKIMQEGDDNDFEMDEEKFKKHFMSMQPVTSKTSITSRKIIKTLDSEGNITEKIINEGDSDFSLDEDESKTTFLSSIPVAVKTTSVHTSRKIIKKTDESGNTIKEIIVDPVTESSDVGQIQAEENFDIG